MKVADVAEFYAEQGGGVRTYIDRKLEAADRLGHELVVVAPGPADRVEDRPGGRIRWIRSRPMPIDPRYYLLLRESAVHAALDAERPDVVEGSSPWTGGWFAARWPGAARKAFVFHQDPVAVYPHTALDRWLSVASIDRGCEPYWAYLRRLSAHFDLTVTSAQWLADRLAGHGVRHPVSVPFGIEKHVFSPDLRSNDTRRQWLARCGYGEDVPLAVIVSRFHPEKRLGTLFKAYDRVAAHREIGLVVFGDGPLRGLVDRAVRRRPGVVLGGFLRGRRDLAVALASADLLLHGSAAETFGLAVAEALCSGLPIVVPDRGGAAELADPAYAECYPPGDVEACAAAIGRMLDRDPAALRPMAARAAAERVRSVEEHFAALFQIYAGADTAR
jgi:alpha-1,6-mannosyltransferase